MGSCRTSSAQNAVDGVKVQVAVVSRPRASVSLPVGDSCHCADPPGGVSLWKNQKGEGHFRRRLRGPRCRCHFFFFCSVVRGRIFVRRRLVRLHSFGPADALKSGTGNTSGVFMMTVEQQDAPWSFWLKFHEHVVTCFAQIRGGGGARRIGILG